MPPVLRPLLAPFHVIKLSLILCTNPLSTNRSKKETHTNYIKKDIYQFLELWLMLHGIIGIRWLLILVKLESIYSCFAASSSKVSCNLERWRWMQRMSFEFQMSMQGVWVYIYIYIYIWASTQTASSFSKSCYLLWQIWNFLESS